jgi:predicted enzyme related to lactoylglutathione lyase
MDQFTPPPVGTVVSVDLTTDIADDLREFYSAVMNWQTTPISMGEYDDYAMMSPNGADWAGGICHRRGPNSDQPAGWMVYFRVGDLDHAIAQVVANGGLVIGDVRESGPGSRFAIIQDPSGATLALIEFAETTG